MGRSSRFTPEERRQAVERAFGPDGDGDPAAVAATLGVHAATLYRWAKAGAEPARATRADARLVRAALDELREHDYGEITVEAVATRAGVALRTAFHHFPTKGDLFGAAVDHVAEALVAEMGRRSLEEAWPATPLGQLHLLLRVAGGAVYAVPDAHVLFRDLGLPSADGPARRWHGMFEAAIEQLLVEAAEAGELDPELTPAGAATVLARAMRGIHAGVFDGGDERQAARMIDRLHLVVAAADR